MRLLFPLLLLTTAASAQPTPPTRDLVNRIFSMVDTHTTFELTHRPSEEPQEEVYLFDPARADGTTAAPLELTLNFSTTTSDLQLGFAGAGVTGEVYLDSVHLGPITATGGPPERRDYSFAVFPESLPLPAQYADGKPHTLTLRRLRFDTTDQHTGLYFAWVAPNGMTEKVSAQQAVSGQPVPYRWRTAGGEWRAPTLPPLPESGEPLAWSDFRYFTGAILAALSDAAAYYGEPRFSDYVDRHHRFFFDHRREVGQLRDRHGLRGGLFSHYYRFLMLDDFGPQGVTIAERAAALPASTNHPLATEELQLANAIAHQLLYAVPRLADGTLCRITPDSFTVQSDDLFMANLFSLRAGRALGREDLLEDALLQSVNFSGYLTDAESGLYRHAYYTRTGRQSNTLWGRGMGWTMLADAMLLEQLAGRDDPRLEEVTGSFRARCAALLRYQSDDGRWHQVINDPTTYKETSCTAMFTYALATGYRMGWLTGTEYREAALRGYRGMSAQVGTDGTVTGTVMGTPILPDPAAYNAHPTRENDPRGIGAILWATMAVDRLDD